MLILDASWSNLSRLCSLWQVTIEVLWIFLSSCNTKIHWCAIKEQTYSTEHSLAVCLTWMTHITLLKTSELLSQRKVITLSAKMWLIDCKLGLLSLILPIAFICTYYRGTTGNLELNFKVKRRLRGMLPPTFRVHRKRHSKQIISSIIQIVSKCYLCGNRKPTKYEYFFSDIYFFVPFSKRIFQIFAN